ncbi:MAG TPA: DNA gyrase inhibitor YacG [Methylophilaceae bacterium]|nr:DNA gyrase inhibitor YacG [Methylophilaceae bacterium]HQR59881.1 DNA gyrase inhibitor YacG [Methylophilaceae bacterium]
MVACPTCGAQTEYTSANPYRPFCSRRCKLIDLGQWATENYRIPENQKPEPADEEK